MWITDNKQVSIGLRFISRVVNKIKMDERRFDVHLFREELIQGLMIELMEKESFAQKAEFDDDIRHYALSIYRARYLDLLEKNGVFRTGRKSDKEQEGKYIQIYFESVTTTDAEGDDQDKVYTILPSDNMSVDREVFLQQIHRTLNEVVTSVLTKIEADDPAKARFLSHVFWDGGFGVSYLELANLVGFEASNLPQIVRRFVDGVKTQLEKKSLNIDIELTSNEVDFLLDKDNS